MGSLVGYGMGKYDKGYVFGGYVVGLVVGGYAIWHFVFEYHLIVARPVLFGFWITLGTIALLLWRLWQVSPPAPQVEQRRDWNKRRLAGWWAVECYALVGLLVGEFAVQLALNWGVT